MVDPNAHTNIMIMFTQGMNIMSIVTIQSAKVLAPPARRPPPDMPADKAAAAGTADKAAAAADRTAAADKAAAGTVPGHYSGSGCPCLINCCGPSISPSDIP